MEMKKSWVVISIIFLSLVVVAPVQSAPLNGTVKELDGKGNLKTMLKYKDGRLVRKRLYHKSGQLISDTILKNGSAVVRKTYYLNGKLKSSWTQKSGEARFYYPTGQPNVVVPMKNPAGLD